MSEDKRERLVVEAAQWRELVRLARRRGWLPHMITPENIATQLPRRWSIGLFEERERQADGSD